MELSRDFVEGLLNRCTCSNPHLVGNSLELVLLLSTRDLPEFLLWDSIHKAF